MGCDIHIAVEVSNGVTWKTARSVDMWRNYRVFSALAGVRNDDNVFPIALPRGLPRDMDKASHEHLFSGHSQSWLLLSEIRRYLDRNATTVIPFEGYIRLEDVEGFVKDWKPQGWCRDVGGGSIRKISLAEAQAMLRGDLPRDPEASYYVHVHWHSRLVETLAPLAELCTELEQLGPPDRVRLVFDFDS